MYLIGENIERYKTNETVNVKVKREFNQGINQYKNKIKTASQTPQQMQMKNKKLM